MSTFQTVFARVEKKFALDPDQYGSMTQVLRLHGFTRMEYPDPNTCSIYFDTEDCQLIRRSIERPNYKEKLRLRIYGHMATDASVAFPEIKKKYQGIVYKRRVQMTYADAYDAMISGVMPQTSGQIGREIAYFHDLYQGLRPRAIVAYERETWQAPDGVDLRVTFDSRIRFRADDLDLRHGSEGHLLVPSQIRMMELKLPMVFPQWMTDALWGLDIHQVHFSKYGEGYRRYIAQMPEQILNPTNPTEKVKEAHYVA